MIIPFAVTGLASAMGATAVITTYQRTTDADWVRPEMNSIRGGIFADGIAASVAGLLGTYGLTVSTANVGLVAATGVASRRIAFVIAGILALAAFQPGFARRAHDHAAAGDGGGAVVHRRLHHDQRDPDHLLAYARCSPHAGDRHGHDGVPPRFGLPGDVCWCAALGAAAGKLSAGAGDAGRARRSISLFRLGIRRKVRMSIDPAAPSTTQEIANFVERKCGDLGARRYVVARVDFALQQAAEAIVENCQVEWADRGRDRL